jgi:hypothetical protein
MARKIVSEAEREALEQAERLWEDAEQVLSAVEQKQRRSGRSGEPSASASAPAPTSNPGLIDLELLQLELEQARMRVRIAEDELRHLRIETHVISRHVDAGTAGSELADAATIVSRDDAESAVESARMALAWMFSATEAEVDRLDPEDRIAAHNELNQILRNFDEGMGYLWEAISLARRTLQRVVDSDRARAGMEISGSHDARIVSDSWPAA